MKVRNGTGRLPSLGIRCGIGFVFLTHKSDEGVLRRILHLAEAIRKNDHLYVMVDSSSGESVAEFLKQSLEQHPQISVQVFSPGSIREQLGIESYGSGRTVPGSTHLPVLSLFSSTRHSFILSIEWDVVLKGEWRLFVDAVLEDAPDLVCSFLRRKTTSEEWYWWKRDQQLMEKMQPGATSDFWAAFLPVWGASPRFLRKLITSQRKGASGHYEWLLPTVARAHRMRTLDFFNSERLRSDERTRETSKRSSFHHRPPIEKGEYDRLPLGRITHPVKDTSIGP